MEISRDKLKLLIIEIGAAKKAEEEILMRKYGPKSSQKRKQHYAIWQMLIHDTDALEILKNKMKIKLKYKQ